MYGQIEVYAVFAYTSKLPTVDNDEGDFERVTVSFKNFIIKEETNDQTMILAYEEGITSNLSACRGLQVQTYHLKRGSEEQGGGLSNQAMVALIQPAEDAQPLCGRPIDIEICYGLRGEFMTLNHNHVEIEFV